MPLPNTNLSNKDNIDNSFTKLFSILKRNELNSAGEIDLMYSTDELENIHQHIDMEMDILLRGIKILGLMVSHFTVEVEEDFNLPNLGSCIASLSNLVEALVNLRLDIEFFLRQRSKTE